LFELGGISRAEYLSKRNDLLIERDELEVQPAAASLALQRQRIQSIVDFWSVMTDEEKKRLLQLIFTEIRADPRRRAPSSRLQGSAGVGALRGGGLGAPPSGRNRTTSCCHI